MPGQHQRGSLTASCKPSWGRFLLRFLPPAVLPAPALGWRQRPSPGHNTGPLAKGTDAVARAVARAAGDGLRSAHNTAPVVGPEAKQGQVGLEAGWDTCAFPEV